MSNARKRAKAQALRWRHRHEAVKQGLGWSERAQLRRRNLELQGYRCAYCWCPLTPKRATLDHIIPKAKGGADDYENTVAACIQCNKLKGARCWIDFWNWAGRIRQHHRRTA